MKKYFFALFFAVTATFCYAQDKIAYLNVQEFLGPIPEYQQILKEGENLSKAAEEWLADLEKGNYSDKYKLEKMQDYKNYHQKTVDSLTMELVNLINYHSQAMGQIATANGFVVILDNSDENNPDSFWFSQTILTKSTDYLEEIGIGIINSEEIIENNSKFNEIQQNIIALQEAVSKKDSSDYEKFLEATKNAHDDVYDSLFYSLDLKNRAIAGLEPGFHDKMDKIILDKKEHLSNEYFITQSKLKEEYDSKMAKLSEEQDAEINKEKIKVINETKAKGQVLLLDKRNPDSPNLVWVAPSILENPKNELLQYANN